MSDMTSLNQLAQFVGQSSLADQSIPLRRAAINGMVQRMQPRPARKKVGDMLSLVLALSARTRRLVQPRVHVDLDVFAPNGERAVSVEFNAQN